MTKQEFDKAFTSALREFRQLAPRRTGHLALNAIKGKWISNDHFKIWIDESVLIKSANRLGEVAGVDYAYIINNKPEYKTYNWFGKNAYAIGMSIARKLGGMIRK